MILSAELRPCITRSCRTARRRSKTKSYTTHQSIPCRTTMLQTPTRKELLQGLFVSLVQIFRLCVAVGASVLQPHKNDSCISVNIWRNIEKIIMLVWGEPRLEWRILLNNEKHCDFNYFPDTNDFCWTARIYQTRETINTYRIMWETVISDLIQRWENNTKIDLERRSEVYWVEPLVGICHSTEPMQYDTEESVSCYILGQKMAHCLVKNSRWSQFILAWCLLTSGRAAETLHLHKWYWLYSNATENVVWYDK